MSLLEDAIIFATRQHKGQTRKHYNLPFIVHPLEVMSKLKIWGIVDENVLAAAVCHDVLEDCKCEFSELYYVIGKKAFDMVVDLTFEWDAKKYPQKKDAKQEYLLSFQNKSLESLIIKIADRLCNINDFYNYDKGYIKKYLKKTEPLFNICVSRAKELPEEAVLECEKWINI